MRREEKIKLTGDALVKAIATACEGLIYISETDSRVRPVVVDKADAATPEDAVAYLERKQGVSFSERTANEFFEFLTKDRTWHDRSKKESVRHFRILKELLYANLAGLREFRVGKIRIVIYVIGRDVAGNIAGISTESVET